MVSSLVNAHLEGDSFFWEGGPSGVLLLHGFTATTAEVRPLAKVLHQKGYTVAGPLLPGHGTTPEDCNRHGWRQWLQAAEDSYRQLTRHGERVFVGGESMGGLLALYLATEHPQVTGVLAYAPALQLRSPWFSFVMPLMALFLPIRPKPPHPKYPSDDLWQGYGVYPLRAAVQLLALQRAVRRRLTAIRRPILIVQGRLDGTVAAEVPPFIAGRVRSVIKEVHWMENSTHTVVLDAEREQVAQLTLRFLEKASHF